MRAAIMLGIQVHVDGDSNIVLTSPHGSRVPLLTLNSSLLTAILRESARHAVMLHLVQRVDADRKDMTGISANVDITATLRLLNDRKSKEDGGGPRLSPKDARILRRLIAGSVRAPDRLKAAKVISDDTCPHACCRGKRCTLEHILWDCPAHHALRQRYSDGIDQYMAMVRKISPCPC